MSDEAKELISADTHRKFKLMTRPNWEANTKKEMAEVIEMSDDVGAKLVNKVAKTSLSGNVLLKAYRGRDRKGEPGSRITNESGSVLYRVLGDDHTITDKDHTPIVTLRRTGDGPPLPFKEKGLFRGSHNRMLERSLLHSAGEYTCWRGNGVGALKDPYLMVLVRGAESEEDMSYTIVEAATRGPQASRVCAEFIPKTELREAGSVHRIAVSVRGIEYKFKLAGGVDPALMLSIFITIHASFKRRADGRY